MNIQSAVELIGERIKQSGRAQSVVIEELWDELELAQQDIESLAKKDGIRFLVGAYLTSGRSPESTTTNVAVSYTNHGTGGTGSSQIHITLKYLKNTVFSVANGEERKLLDFKVEDFDFCISRNQDMIDGLQRHNSAFEFGKSLLVQKNASKISELPIQDQKDFNDAWKQLTDKPEEVAA